MLAALAIEKDAGPDAGREDAGSVRRNSGDQGASHSRRPRAQP